MEKIGRYNGNGKWYERDVPKVIILGGGNFNDVAIAHIEKQTGLKTTIGGFGDNLILEPETTLQIAQLFLTYNFKTQYHDNATNKNTLFLKPCDDSEFKRDF